jgi:molecular chaperone GrpE (heat shock protein)
MDEIGNRTSEEDREFVAKPTDENTVENSESTAETKLFSSLRAELSQVATEIHERSGPVDHQAYIENLSDELARVEEIYRKTLDEGITDSSLDFSLPELYQPSVDPGLRTMSREWRGGGENYYSRLYGLLNQLDTVRCETQRVLQNKFGISPIMSVPGHSKFDPDLHEDNEAHRLPARTEDGDNNIYEQIRPGFVVNGEVMRKAYVKRYVEVSTPQSSQEARSSWREAKKSFDYGDDAV